MIASIAVDYHVTQVVDGTKGIHGMIPKAIFAGAVIAGLDSSGAARRKIGADIGRTENATLSARRTAVR